MSIIWKSVTVVVDDGKGKSHTEEHFDGRHPKLQDVFVTMRPCRRDFLLWNGTGKAVRFDAATKEALAELILSNP